MIDEAMVYCDESGNSGANYLEEGQPLFVIAGWLVPMGKLGDADEVVQTALSGTQMEELKTSKLFRNAPGRQIIKNLIEGMYRLGCVPFYQGLFIKRS